MILYISSVGWVALFALISGSCGKGKNGSAICLSLLEILILIYGYNFFFSQGGLLSECSDCDDKVTQRLQVSWPVTISDIGKY